MSFKQSKLNKLLGITKEYCTLRNLKTERDETEYDSDNEAPFEVKFERNPDRIDSVENIDLQIKPLIKEEDDYLELHPQLPKIPFSFYVVGCRGAGKSVFTQWLGNIINKCFDEIFLFSPTADLDAKWKMFFEEQGIKWKANRNIIYEYTEEKMSKIMRALKKHNKGKSFSEKLRVLFIFDDMITQLPKGKQNTKFNRLILNNRHYNASVIIISQAWKLVDAKFRTNCSQIALWEVENIGEKEKIIDELGGSKYLGDTIKECKRNFLNIWEKATDKKHGCLYINFHSKDIDTRYNTNFDEPIPISHLREKYNKKPKELPNTSNKKDFEEEELLNDSEQKDMSEEEVKEQDDKINEIEDITEDSEMNDIEIKTVNDNKLDKIIKQLMKHKKKTLQKVLQLNGISTKGKKKDLVMRILEIENPEGMELLI